MAGRNNDITLVVAFEGAAEKVLLVHCPTNKREDVLENLQRLGVPQNYPHHPIWALQAGLSGTLADGISSYNVDDARSRTPDIIINSLQRYELA